MLSVRSCVIVVEEVLAKEGGLQDSRERERELVDHECTGLDAIILYLVLVS